MKIFISVVIACIHFNSSWRCYGSSSARYARITEYDGKTCSTADTLFTKITGSLMACSVLCIWNRSCAGVFHKTENGSCVGCSRAAFDKAEGLINDNGTACAYSCDKTGGWEKIGKKKYKLVDGDQAFVKGRIICRRLCADMVHLASRHEQTLLNKWLLFNRKVRHYYIGLTDRKTEGTFLWIDDDTEPVFTAWDSDEPNNNYGNQDFVVVNKLRSVWGDVVGVKKKYTVICEKR